MQPRAPYWPSSAARSASAACACAPVTHVRFRRIMHAHPATLREMMGSHSLLNVVGGTVERERGAGKGERGVQKWEADGEAERV
eukprot:6212968-Pleurochrysis_carterae.AAC.1